MKEIRLALIVLTAPLVVLFALAQLRADYALYRSVRDFGQHATATVQDIEHVSFTGQPEGARRIHYMLDLPGPAILNGSAHVSKTKADRYALGQEIEIVYAETNPALNTLSVKHAWSALVSDIIIFAAYGSVLALAVVLLRTAPRKTWRPTRRTWAR